MSIKRIFIVISAIFAASAVFADNSSVTSKKYVDDLMSGYQGKLPGSGANTLMIYDNSEDGIGEKAIAATLGNSASATSVPTVGAVKTGLDGKQDTITGTAGYVMTGTGTAGNVDEKPIYGATTNYSDSLVTAEAVNTGVINAVNNSLIRVDANGNPDDNGLLWQISDYLLAINAKVPYGYTELQYIESNGTQYIDTNLVLDEMASEVFIDFQKTNATANVSIMGCQKSDSGYNLRQTYYFTGGDVLRLYNSTANSNSLIGSGITQNRHTIHTIIDNNNNITVDFDGTVTDYTQVQVPNNVLKLFLFANNANGAATQKISAKMYRVWIKNASGILVRDFIPAKNSSDVAGMYDTVSGRFFPDAAGGNFTAGPSCISPNLFDKNNTTVLNLGITASDGVGYYSTNSARYGVAVKVNPNTTYTWSFNRGTQSAYINFGESADYPTNGGACSYVGIGTSSSTYTFTTKSTTNYVYFYTTDTSFVNTMQLEQGSTATTYRPYGENICD